MTTRSTETFSLSQAKLRRRGLRTIAFTAQLFRARQTGPAVVVLAQWNARWEEQQDICRWLNRLGITAVKMSLPYHDRRAIPGHPRGDHLVGPNIGLTLQANRQAVLDVRRTLRWLELQGYDRLGILGTSIGSSIAFVTMCHEPALRAGAFLHVATYCGDVVANGITTMNVWESLQTKVSHRGHAGATGRRSAHFRTSPKLDGTGKKILAISGTLRSDVLAGIHERVFAGSAARRVADRDSFASVRALLVGRRALQVRGGIPARDVFVSVFSLETKAKFKSITTEGTEKTPRTQRKPNRFTAEAQRALRKSRNDA